MKYYDSHNNRLVFVQHASDSNYWDTLWLKHEIQKTIYYVNRLVTGATQKHLQKGAYILEGGCGLGNNVMALTKNGYRCTGVDYAQKSVKLLNEFFPHLEIEYGDLRDLKYDSECFDGYWSVGVIEHYFNGYEDIADEMYRVLKPNGILFLTFPYMSPLRKWKSRLKLYPPVDNNTQSQPADFYQFALDHHRVVEFFSNRGFQLMETRPFSSYKGILEEIRIADRLLKPLTDHKGKNPVIRLTRAVIDRLFVPVAAHCVLLVMKKETIRSISSGHR